MKGIKKFFIFLLILFIFSGSSFAMDLQWWQKIIVYQIYPKSFQDTDDSGKGDINGIIKHLDYLKSLGVGAIWITPFYPSPGVDNGLHCKRPSLRNYAGF